MLDCARRWCQREEEWARDPIPAIRDTLVPAVMSQGDWEHLVEQVKVEVLAARDAAMAQLARARAIIQEGR